MTRIFRALVLAALLTPAVLAPSAPAAAQEAPRQEADPFASVLFPPELIMQHARAINLTGRQRTEITRLIGDVQQRVLSLQWQLAEQVQALKQTLSAARVDQDRAIDQLNRVLETEKSIKQAHLEMLIRIKNLLAREQQTELARLRGNTGADRNDLDQEGKS